MVHIQRWVTKEIWCYYSKVESPEKLKTVPGVAFTSI